MAKIHGHTVNAAERAHEYGQISTTGFAHVLNGMSLTEARQYYPAFIVGDQVSVIGGGDAVEKIVAVHTPTRNGHVTLTLKSGRRVPHYMVRVVEPATRDGYVEPPAGLVERRQRRTGTHVAIYKAADAGLDTEGGPYAAVCEEHGTIHNFANLSTARAHAPYVDWCEECQNVEGNGNAPAAGFMASAAGISGGILIPAGGVVATIATTLSMI